MIRRIGASVAILTAGLWTPGCGFQTPQKLEPPAVYLNHVTRVLDEKTYREIADSGFLSGQFSALETSLISDAEASWSGTYLHGRRTYLEFFPAEPESRRREGASAVVFGVEEPGGADRLFELFAVRINENLRHRLRHRKIGETETPWFFETSVNYEDPDALLATWVMEYHPDYLQTRYPDLDSEEAGITREHYQAPRYQSDRLFSDIEEAVLALDAAESGRLLDQLTVFGWEIEQDKLETRCRGPQILLRIVPRSEAAQGLAAVTLRLNQVKKGEKVYRFGERSVLRFDDGLTAVWTF